MDRAVINYVLMCTVTLPMNLGKVDRPPVNVAAPATSASDFNYRTTNEKIELVSQLVGQLIS